MPVRPDGEPPADGVPAGDGDGPPNDAAPGDAALPPPLPPVESVDPFIGTGQLVFNVGNALPGATRPFGMVKVSPDTSNNGGAPLVSHCAGYSYNDRHIEGFTHMHLHGTGVPDYENILFMPTAGMSPEKTRAAGYRAAFSHANEAAAPGYYTVTFDAPAIRTELTASEHAAFHRYTFPAGAAETVVIDVARTAVEGHTNGGEVFVDPAGRRVYGWMHNVGPFSGRYGGFKVWFDALFDRPFASHGTWDDQGLVASREAAAGLLIGAHVDFDPAQGTTVQAQVGISLVGPEGARQNREAELGDLDFDAARTAAAADWAQQLGRIAIQGTTARERTLFYTGLYHALFMPTLLTDVDGRYRGFDGEVHEAQGFRYYTDFSLWDTFRTLHPLLLLLDPERSADMAQSLVTMAEQGGVLPRWPMGTGRTGSMIGSPQDCVLSESVLKGVTDFDVDAAYAYMREVAMAENPVGGRGDMGDYLTLGYVAADRANDSVSKTLEYAYEDYCVARLAEALGQDADADLFYTRAFNYGVLWDPETLFFRPKNADGSWAEGFVPTWTSEHFTEATPWQYRFYVPQDVPNFARLFGSNERFAAELDTFFAEAAAQFRFALPTAYYYHGNEPSLHAAYLFNEVGRPAQTQQWVRWILDTNYEARPDGLIGNDDAGTLSAWYVFSALGFYPQPGTERYFIGSPIVAEAVVQLPGGELVIRADNQAPAHRYVQSVRWNGASLSDPYLYHDDLAGGGELHFVMGPEPSSWGAPGK